MMLVLWINLCAVLAVFSPAHFIDVSEQLCVFFHQITLLILHRMGGVMRVEIRLSKSTCARAHE